MKITAINTLNFSARHKIQDNKKTELEILKRKCALLKQDKIYLQDKIDCLELENSSLKKALAKAEDKNKIYARTLSSLSN